MTEIFRAGIQSIDKGQMEAGRATGLSHAQTMRYIIVPQAFRRTIPPLTNEFVTLVKNTSLVSVIGLAELLRAALAQLESGALDAAGSTKSCGNMKPPARDGG